MESSQKNGVYDEVRFAKEWRGTMYRIPAKNVGPCVMSNTAPAFMPYTDRETAIMDLTIKGTTTKIGSAFAVQRAGGSYALTSGEWAMEKQPQFKYEGGAKQVQSRYDWTIEKGKYGVPFVSLMYDGKGAWQSFDDTHLHQRNVTHIYRRTPVKSPEGGTFKLVMVQSTDCAKVCRNNRGDEHVVMEYNIEAPKRDKAKMNAITGIYLYSVYGNANNDSFDDLRDRMANGIRIDGSFGETNDRKEKKVEGDQTGTVTLQARQAYYLQDLAYWELWDATVGLDAVYYWYRSKITPVAVYLTK